MGEKTHLACLARSKPPPKALVLIERGMIVAHKRMRCYTIITVCVSRTQKCAEAVVADWGPVHADIDLYAPLSRALKHNGDETAHWVAR